MVRCVVPSWATMDPCNMSAKTPGSCLNLLAGEWVSASAELSLVDPLTGDPFLTVPATSVEELGNFVASLNSCPKHGLHNPLFKPERYRLLGDVSARAAAIMRDPAVEDYLAKAIQRVVPKSYAQALGEVRVTTTFMANFSGDQVRFLARSFAVSGDHTGQHSSGHRFPFGPVVLITPFNFPVEIPMLQLMGALYMGNKVTCKVDSRVSIVFEQMLRLLHHAGLPRTDCDFLNCSGDVMNHFLLQARPASTLFTGSSKVGEQLATQLAGRIFLEDGGYDWKILGPSPPTAPHEVDYVAWQCDQDAYACSGQKCSAQSICFAHADWTAIGLFDKLKANAARRSLADLSVGPTLSVTTATIQTHLARLLEIPGARLLFGGRELAGHTIPDIYGAMEPTAVFVPLSELVKGMPTGGAVGPATRGPLREPCADERLSNFELCTTEIFAPFQIVTEYDDASLESVLQVLEAMRNHLTAAVVSNDQAFLQTVLSRTVNGTTYAGIRARTTGAPANHHFGPSGDPRAASIGTPEAIRLCWSSHREIVSDVGPIAANWVQPPPS